MILRGRHLSRIFTTTELAYAKDNATTLAGNFAVKEAVSKVFGTGFFGVEPYEIEVLRNESGAPYVKLYGNAKEIAKINKFQEFMYRSRIQENLHKLLR